MKKLVLPLLIAGLLSSIVFGPLNASCSHCEKNQPSKPSCHQAKAPIKKSCHTTQSDAPKSCHQGQSQASDCQISCQTDEAISKVEILDFGSKNYLELVVPVAVSIAPTPVSPTITFYVHDPHVSYSGTLGLLKPIRLLC